MRRLLLISPHFPPSAGVAAKRPLRFVRHLPAQGWNPVVLTAEGAAGGSDPELLECLPPGLEIARTYTSGVFGRLFGRLEHGKASVLHARSSRWAPFVRWLTNVTYDLFPLDKFLPFLWHAASTAGRLARESRARCILATGFPMSALLAAVWAGQGNGLPVILDLRDPWTLNPMYFWRKPRPIRALERRVEAYCFAHAARVLFNTELAREAYCRLYPQLASKFFCLRNGFDRGLFRAEPATGQPGFSIAHFGTFHGGRTLAPILEAMKRIEPDSRLVSFGPVPAEDVRLAERLDLVHRLEVRSPLPYRRSLGPLSSFDALVLLQPLDADLLISAKLYDYLCVGRPVVAVAGNSELEQILRECHAGVMVQGVDQIAEVLAAIRRGAIGPPDPGAVARFDAPNQVVELARHLEAVT